MLHLVKGWWSRFVARSQVESVVVAPPPRNEIEELMDVWNAIEAERLNGVFSSDMSILNAFLRKSNIREYGKYLDMVVDHFKRDVDLKPVLTDLPRNQVFLNDFFTSEKGFYLDVQVEFKEFRERVISFLEHYEKAKTNVDKSFETQRNLSLTMSVVAELKQLADVLQP